MAKTIVLLSGGLDSSVLLYALKYEDHECIALCADYGQRHELEIVSALAIARDAGVKIVSANMAHALGPLFANAASSQVGKRVDVPTGHYADESMRTTIVPNRNMLLIALAGSLAVSVNATHIAYAAHAGDHAIYPDCRPEFAMAMRNALRLCNEPGLMLVTPFLHLTKAEIVARGHALHVPFKMTRSCYENRIRHCGLCGTCYERREAFQLAGVEDPTTYEADGANRERMDV